MDDTQAFVPNVHFDLIPIKNLVSNQTYQRQIRMSAVERAARSFDVHQINPVKVSRRNGINYVFNGQHTIEIVALVSGSRDTPVWCMIYDDLVYTEEADIFANQSKFVRPLLPIETFIANIEAGSDKQLIIKDLVESYGLKISSKSMQGAIGAVSTLESIYDRYGYSLLERVIRLCVMTWEGEPRSLSSSIMSGLAKLLYVYEDKIKDEVFIEKLRDVSPGRITSTARERQGGAIGYAEAILIFYNKRSRYPLQRDLLYKNKPKAKIQPSIENEPVTEDGGDDVGEVEEITPEVEHCDNEIAEQSH